MRLGTREINVCGPFPSSRDTKGPQALINRVHTGLRRTSAHR